MIDLIINKLLRPFGFRIIKLEKGIKIIRFFGNKTFNVGDYRIKSPSTHPLAKNLRRYKYYSRNLSRLVDIISSQIPDLEVIDVGANIGDSAAFVNSVGVKPKKIYCFEGEKEYICYFKHNTSSMNNVVLFETFLGENDNEKNFNVYKDDGTLRIDTTKKGEIQIDSLDNILNSHKELENVKFLKTDTDGYDFKILRGAKKIITKAKPILFFEYDRVYLDKVNDDGFSTFDMLEDLGYDKAIFYDNYGRLLLSVSITNKQNLHQLDQYIKDYKGSFYYYDICLFHKNDNAIFEKVINKEFQFFKNQD